MRWQGPLLLVAGHVPHGRHLPTTCGRHCYSEHTPRLGFWLHQIPASCVTWTTPQRNCPNPIHHKHTPRHGFGSPQFPASWSHGPLRGGTAQAPPIRLVRSMLSQHVALHIFPQAASTSLKIARRTVLLFALRGKGHLHDDPRTSILEPTLRRNIDGDSAC